MAIAYMLGATAILRFARLSPAAVIVLLAVVTGIGWVYMRRRGEDRFLLDLGYGRMAQLTTLLAAPISGECWVLLALPM